MFFQQFFSGFPNKQDPSLDVSNDELYEILGLPKNSSQSEIKKKFFKLAKKYHPDKGGESEKVEICIRKYY